ncbi:hypothetical protein EPO05_05660 [Patescibacteria group bacterium]|nr:MAG: hypothetical protein EPO05_05660 [Patescibacteria group bacterium]
MKRWQESLPQHLQVSIQRILQCLHRCLAESGQTIQPGDIFVDLERTGMTGESACWTARLIIDQGNVTHLNTPSVTINHAGEIEFRESGLHEFLRGRQCMLVGVFPGTEGLLPPTISSSFERFSDSLGARAAIIVGPHWHKVLNQA